MVVFTLLLNSVHLFANFLFNLNRELNMAVNELIHLVFEPFHFVQLVSQVMIWASGGSDVNASIMLANVSLITDSCLTFPAHARPGKLRGFELHC